MAVFVIIRILSLIKKFLENIEKSLTPEREKTCQDKLADALCHKNPEATEFTVEQRNRLKSNVTARENVINDTELLDILKEYKIDLNQIEISENENGYFVITIKNNFNKEKLPLGHAYKGGAARALLLRNLSIDNKAAPRDIDIVRLQNQEGFEETDKLLAQKYMPDDYSHGYGVEYIKDSDEYFNTRDFTLNEVIATDEQITATRQCVLDTVRHIIRLTDYERYKDDDDDRNGSVDSKMLAKALRLYSETIYKYGEADIENINDWEYEEYFITPFWLAVNLDRAFENGTMAAEQFVEILKMKNQIPDHINAPEEAAKYLLDIMRDNATFYYRHAPIKQFDAEDGLISKYKNLPKFEKIRKKS